MENKLWILEYFFQEAIEQHTSDLGIKKKAMSHRNERSKISQEGRGLSQPSSTCHFVISFSKEKLVIGFMPLIEEQMQCLVEIKITICSSLSSS